MENLEVCTCVGCGGEFDFEDMIELEDNEYVCPECYEEWLEEAKALEYEYKRASLVGYR